MYINSGYSWNAFGKTGHELKQTILGNKHIILITRKQEKELNNKKI